MVPLGPPLLAYSSKCKAMLAAVDDAVQLVVDRPYKAGESIVVWYNISFTGHDFKLLFSVFLVIKTCLLVAPFVCLIIT